MQKVIRRRLHVAGITQGVGFRPFVWRLAERLGLTGWVQNDSSGLRCEIQGDPVAVESFLVRLHRDSPPLARLDEVDVAELPPSPAETRFTIRPSEQRSGLSTPVSPDIATCSECLRELTDPRNRRYGYPFTNCTNCGPRFTIIEDIPYDRPHTTMKSFPMCGQCQEEYDDPANRRFHAQPNACPDCGPHIWFEVVGKTIASSDASDCKGACRPNPIEAFADAIKAGRIVAVKGIGGFHLVCDAANPLAVAALRERKGRVAKPFAVMAATVEQVGEFARVHEGERISLTSKERPIVLLSKRPSSPLKQMLEAVAPHNDFVGVMLPYSPLHHLLIQVHSPLVVTSGNVSEETIARTNEEARARLSRLADAFLFHNREIHVACDDSVVRSVDGTLLPIRRSRGYAPMPISLASSGPSVLAVGGEMKSTLCVTKDNVAYVSQHIGEVGNAETLEALQRTAEHFLRLFRVDIDAVAGDLHPGYLSSRWGRQFAHRLGVPFIPVQHHFAHAVALMAERSTASASPMIACCFDGTGYGTDGAIWGGEFLVADYQHFQRVAHLQSFALPGSDASIRRPYRAALSLLWQLGLDWHERLPCVMACPSAERVVLRQQLARQLHCPRTSSMGRLFDAIASLVGVRQEISYEAQAAMELEALAASHSSGLAQGDYAFDLRTNVPIEIGYATLVSNIYRDVQLGVAPSRIASRFHHAVANLIGSVCEQLRDQHGLNRVGLTGGVFQNVFLLRLTIKVLQRRGFEVVSHTLVPPNDGGLSLGQAVVARSRLSSS